MATKSGYSAGRVFLQVVPSYRNFLITLRRDAAGPLGKAIADTFEKDLNKRGQHVGEQFGKDVGKNIEKNVDTKGAGRKLERDLGKSLRGVDRDARNTTRSVDRLGNRIRDTHNDAQDGANAFRFFNAAVLTASAVGAGLIPVLAAIAGGAIMLGPILAGLGAGAGVAIFGLSGLSGAVKALGAQQDATASSSLAYQRGLVSAARAVADARRSLKDAYRNSAEGIRNALERQADAERNLTDAQRDATEAQRDLVDARKEAAQEQEDLSNRIAQNALDERQGVIDLFNAYNQFGAVMNDGGSTNLEREQADIALKQAQLNLKMIREEQKRLADQQKQSVKDGIDGADNVRRAEERLRGALERVRDANRQVAKATRDVSRARADGARSIADAQRALNRAQEDYAAAAQGSAAATDNVAEAMRKLGPAGQKFARYLFSLREGFYRLRNEVQKGFLPGVQEMLQRIIGTYGPGFTSWMREVGALLGELSREAGKTFTNATWRNFFDDFGRSSKIFIDDGGRGFLDFLTGMASLFGVALPDAERMSGAIRDMFGRFREWAESEKGKGSFRSFLEYVKRVGPDVIDFFLAVGDAFFSIAKALAPIGEKVLSALTNFFERVSRLDPGQLRQIGIALLTITFALQAAAGIQAMVALIGALAAAPLLAVAAIALLVGGLVLLGRSGKQNKKMFDDLKKAMKPVLEVFQDIYKDLKERFLKVWRDDLQPALDKIVETIQRDLLPALERFMPVLKPIVTFLVDVLFAQFGAAFELMGTVISGIIKILSGLLDFVTGVFTGDWSLAWSGIKKIFSGAFDIMKGVVKFFWRTIKDAFRFGWEFLKSVASSGGTSVKNLFVKMKDKSIEALDDLWESVKDIMGKIGSALKKPIVGFLDLVLNDGLIDAIRTLQSWIGISKKNRLPHASGYGGKYAEGGVLPGYTPGRDVHHFVSPTAGALHLSGGEAIMRPEFTKAVGGEKGVARLNNLARKGMAFAKGGVVWPTNKKHWTTYPGHDGIDINGPGNGMGDPYYATEDGRVVYTGWGRGYGLKTELKTRSGPTVIFGHSSKIIARVGQQVMRGQQIGRIGSTGRSTGPHLHFGLKGEPKDMGALALKYLSGAKIGGHGSSDKLAGLSSAALNALKDPKKYLEQHVASGFRNLGGVGGGMLEMLKGVPKKLIDGLAEKIKDLAMKGLDIGKSFFKYTPIGLGVQGVKKLGGYLFDQGGWLPPGLSTVYNATGKPEPVFNPEQWEKISQGGMGGGDTWNLVANGADPNAVVRKFVDDIRFERRRARRSANPGKVTP